METDKILNIFDFDGTIFRSPAVTPWHCDGALQSKLKSPKNQQGLCWYQDIRTLSEPLVPTTPHLSWFIEDTREEILKSMSNPNAYTVLLTGRTTSYADTVRTICESAGMEFDNMGFKPVAQDATVYTMDFKLSFINEQIAAFKPTTVNLWEDRIRHATRFERFFREAHPKLKATVILVPSEDTYLHPKLESEIILSLRDQYQKNLEIKQVTRYTTVFLDDESKLKLLEAFPSPKSWHRFYSHMEICRGPLSVESLPKAQSITPRTNKSKMGLKTMKEGSEVELKVTGVYKGTSHYIVRVDGFISANHTPMIVLATSRDSRFDSSLKVPSWEELSDPSQALVLKGEIHQVKYSSIAPGQKGRNRNQKQKGGEKEEAEEEVTGGKKLPPRRPGGNNGKKVKKGKK